mgnify:FL=1
MDYYTPCMSCEKSTLWIIGATVTSEKRKLVVYCMDCRESFKPPQQEVCPECEHPIGEGSNKCWNCESWGGGREIG